MISAFSLLYYISSRGLRLLRRLLTPSQPQPRLEPSIATDRAREDEDGLASKNSGFPNSDGRTGVVVVETPICRV